jgi:DNA-binding MarR family transcriptional regulator
MPSSTATDAPAREAWGLFWQIFTGDKQRRMTTLNELGLAPMQAMALQQLQPGTPLPMSALADALHCDNSNVTGIVDRLEAAGLVERRPGDHDRRVKTLVVTERGVQLRDQVSERMSVPPGPIGNLSERDAVALRDILRRALET